MVDTLHIEEHIARIAKEKNIFYVHFNSLVNTQILGRSNKRVKSSKQLGCTHFYVNQVVSDSRHLVFYSAQRYVTTYGYATNWNCTGYYEVYNFLRK